MVRPGKPTLQGSRGYNGQSVRTRPTTDEHFFPPVPQGLRGRGHELATLVTSVRSALPARIALVGSGGSGKSMLAAALGHRLAKTFGGRIHWFRVGAWDFSTLTEIMALRFGTTRERGAIARGGNAIVRGLRRFLDASGPRLVVLDNHEDDRAMARLLDALAGTPATFIITARRCLLSGVSIFPVTAPRITSGRPAFPRVASLTRMLRWNPLALDIADAMVASRATSVEALATHLVGRGVTRVRAIEHEDDLPEVGLLVEWAFRRVGPASRRLLAVLAQSEGDHMDRAALAKLARLRGDVAEAALRPLLRFHLVQEPLPQRFALHAVVRHAVRKRARIDAAAYGARAFAYYVSLVEADPTRLSTEETHLFAAMDYAQRKGDMQAILRLDALFRTLEASPP
jgi:hypothetical protein